MIISASFFSCFSFLFCSLQDEFTRSQEELKRLLSDRQAQQEKVQLLLVELRGELLDKTRELEELRLQVHVEREERKSQRVELNSFGFRFTPDLSKIFS